MMTPARTRGSRHPDAVARAEVHSPEQHNPPAPRCPPFVPGLEWIAVRGSLSQADIDYIREGYRLFKNGDPAFLDRFTPDATLVFPETLPRGGTYNSPWDALEYFNRVGELFDDPHAKPEE